MEIEKDKLQKIMNEKEKLEYKICMIRSTIEKQEIGLLSFQDAINEINDLVNPLYRPAFRVTDFDLGLGEKESKSKNVNVYNKYLDGFEKFKKDHPMKNKRPNDKMGKKEWFNSARQYTKEEWDLKKEYEKTLPKEMVKEVEDYLHN